MEVNTKLTGPAIYHYPTYRKKAKLTEIVAHVTEQARMVFFQRAYEHLQIVYVSPRRVWLGFKPILVIRYTFRGYNHGYITALYSGSRIHFFGYIPDELDAGNRASLGSV